MPWTPVSIEGTHLHIRYITGDGSATLPAGVQVQQDSHAVSITAWSITQSHDGPLPQPLGFGEATITLDAPLGSRPLLHAPVAPTWKSYAAQLAQA